MSEMLRVGIEGVRANGQVTRIGMEMTDLELLSHLKQMIKSLSQSGIVHEIEDRKNPFNGVQVDYIEIYRVADMEVVECEELDDDLDDDELDDDELDDEELDDGDTGDDNDAA